MGVVISCCAKTRGGTAKVRRGLNSGCPLSLETLRMNWLIVVSGLKVGGRNQIFNFSLVDDVD